jgi:hypothetical protein
VLPESGGLEKKTSIVRETTDCGFGINMGYNKNDLNSSSKQSNASLCISIGTSPNSSSLYDSRSLMVFGYFRHIVLTLLTRRQQTSLILAGTGGVH